MVIGGLRLGARAYDRAAMAHTDLAVSGRSRPTFVLDHHPAPHAAPSTALAETVTLGGTVAATVLSLDSVT